MNNLFKQTAIVLLYFIMTLFFSCSKEEFIVKDGKTFRESFYSDTMDYTYQIDIYLPPLFDANKTYPIIYLMDGNAFFSQTAGVIDQLIHSNQIPPSVLIGVGCDENLSDEKYVEQRTRDYTFPIHNGYEDFFDLETGKADLFYKVLVEEIIPKYESEYEINPISKTLAGHSLSGYFACYALFDHHTEIEQFDNFLCASPSLWYGDAYIFNSLQKNADNSNALTAKLYITVGESEGVTMNTHFEAMESKLYEYSIEGLNYKMLRLNHTNHANSPLKSFEGGFKYLLN